MIIRVSHHYWNPSRLFKKRFTTEITRNTQKGVKLITTGDEPARGCKSQKKDSLWLGFHFFPLSYFWIFCGLGFFLLAHLVFWWMSLGLFRYIFIAFPGFSFKFLAFLWITFSSVNSLEILDWNFGLLNCLDFFKILWVPLKSFGCFLNPPAFFWKSCRFSLKYFEFSFV